MSVASLCGPNCDARLYAHVLGSFALFGAILAVTILAFAARHAAPDRARMLRRVAFWTALVLAVPGWIVMYFSGYWVLDHEKLDKDTPGWAEGGIQISHIGAALLILLLLVGWLSWKRPRLGGVFAALAAVYLVLLGAAWFVMSAKP